MTETTPDLTPTDGEIPCTDVPCPVCPAMEGETCHGENGGFVTSHEERCVLSDDTTPGDESDPDDSPKMRFGLRHRARAAMREMGLAATADADHADTSPHLTAAGLFVGSATHCAWCHSLIAAGEPRRLYRVPGLTQPQQYHDHCAREWSKGRP